MLNDSVTLYHGDCLVEMSKIPDGSVDMILTDPPYGTTACKWDNVIPFEPMWAHIWRVLKPNGAVVLFGSEPFSSHLRMSQIKNYKYDWVWVKERGTGFGNASKMPLKKHELVSVFYRQTANYYPIKEALEKPYSHVLPKFNSESGNFGYKSMNSESRITKEYTHKFPHSILEFSRVHNTKTEHPTQKPVALLEYLIKTYTLEGETVLDFTMGSGSTGVACANTGRKFIGIEQDAKYFAIAQERIEKATEKLF